MNNDNLNNLQTQQNNNVNQYSGMQANQPRFNSYNNQSNNNMSHCNNVQANQSQFNSFNNNANYNINNLNDAQSNQPEFNSFNNNLNDNMHQYSKIHPNQQYVNTFNNKGTNNFKNNKKLFIIIAVVILIVIAIIVYLTLFNKEKNDEYLDYLKNEEKINEEINKNYSLKEYKVNTGLVIELNNDNNVVIDADIKIEFFNENGEVVNVEDDYIFNIPAKSKIYEKIYLNNNINFSTYKVTSKLRKSYNQKTYNDKIEIVSKSEQDDYIIMQIKNNSNINLQYVEIGVLFLDKNNTIIDYSINTISDFDAGETISDKVLIPYDSNIRDEINYDKIDILVIHAYSYET